MLHSRGVGNSHYTTAKFTDLSSNLELETCLNFIKDEAGSEADLVGIGLSMGGNLIMKLAGDMKEDFPLQAIVAVNNPFDIWLSISLMRGKIYEKFLVKHIVHETMLPDSRVKRVKADEKHIWTQMN